MQAKLDLVHFTIFVEQICGLKQQIKPIFLFDIIENMTCRLEMGLSGLEIISVEPKSLLLKFVFFFKLNSHKDLWETRFQILPECSTHK